MHAIKQSRAVIPVTNSCPVLIANGFDEVSRFHLSSDFVINASESGQIIDYDEKSNIMIAKYKSGKIQAIDLNPNIVKNGNGGFFLANTLKTDLKVGDKFKANDVLGYHKDFFTNNKYNNCRMNMGTLAKVAIMSTYNTYQDGTFCTEEFSKRASTEMVFLKSVVVGKNSNIEYIVNKGDEIKVGDSLIRFDESFEDDSLNALLANMAANDKEAILANSRNDVQSKFSGVIEDIKIYATVELDEMSPTLKSIVSRHYRAIDAKREFLDKYDETGNKKSVVKCGIMLNETSGITKPNQFGVIKGENVEDGVLIEFYVKHSEPLEIGSKIANFSAIKNTIDEIIPKGYEPYSEFRKDEFIDTIIASNSLLKRMTPSVLVTALGNKCIVELKRSLEDIWNKKTEDRRKKMEALIYKFFNAMDDTGKNTKHYKEIFETMSDNEFKKYFDGFFKEETAYLVLTIVDYESDLTLDEIERAAKVLGIPLFEYVYTPHLTMDKENVVMTQTPVPVGYIICKREQQTLRSHLFDE